VRWGGHKNIEINPVFRGMAFRSGIKIKKKVKFKNGDRTGVVNS